MEKNQRSVDKTAETQGENALFFLILLLYFYRIETKR